MSTLNVEQVNTLGVTVDGNEVSGIPGYNYIINGNFDMWQRATSQTTTGYGSDDRWRNEASGSTKTHSRQSFAVGEMFPDGNLCPKYYSRTAVTSVAGVGNNALKYQLIESVLIFSGKKVTLSFYAKANSNKNMSVEFIQNFGSGGNPLSINAIGITKLALTSTWQRFVVTVNIPSVFGKTLGADSDNIGVVFWFDAGTNFNARTDSLGQQSGTFDLACISLVEGDNDIKPIPRSIGEELVLCKRFYEEIHCIINYSASTMYASHYWSVHKRAAPSLSIRNPTAGQPTFVASGLSTIYQSTNPTITGGAIVAGDAEL